MQNNIKFLDIENFKSIRKMRLECKRVNVFIGEPTPRADILTHPKISLTPHVGGSTAEAQENVGRELAGLIINHFSK